MLEVNYYLTSRLLGAALWHVDWLHFHNTLYYKTVTAILSISSNPVRERHCDSQFEIVVASEGSFFRGSVKSK